MQSGFLQVDLLRTMFLASSCSQKSMVNSLSGEGCHELLNGCKTGRCTEFLAWTPQFLGPGSPGSGRLRWALLCGLESIGIAAVDEVSTTVRHHRTNDWRNLRKQACCEETFHEFSWQVNSDEILGQFFCKFPIHSDQTFNHNTPKCEVFHAPTCQGIWSG